MTGVTRGITFLRICTRCHHPRSAIDSRLVRGKFICSVCLSVAREKRRALERR
jgi:formylmethanofuran dehydrogenase subunit E